VTLTGVLAAERRRLTRGDVGVAVVLAALSQVDVWLTPDWSGPAPVNALVTAVMTLSLAWRRHAPLAVLAIAVAGMAGLSLAYGGSQTWTNVFVIVIAVYSATSRGANLFAVFGLTAFGVAVRELRDPLVENLYDALWSSTLVALTIAAGLVGRSLRTRSNLIESRARAVLEEEEELTAAAAAEERRRIARELHDIVSHSLGVLVLQAGAAEQVLDRDPARAREVLRSIRATGQDAISQMGALLGLVSAGPEMSREPQPSLADVDGLVAATRDAGLPVELSVLGAPRDLPALVELSAFRVVQEGLTNVMKHADPARASVTVSYRDQELEVAIVDDGQASQGQGGRRGLAGLRERVAVLGGRFEAGPGPNGGWVLRAAFPIGR
jgi:signal transduction histidine kinase